MDDLTKRVTILETKYEAMEKHIESIAKGVEVANEGIRNIQLELAKKLTCPKPGLSVELNETIQHDILPVIKAHSDTLERLKGAWFILVILGTIIAALSAIVGTWVNHILS